MALLPCPCCGGKAEAYKTSWSGMFKVQCATCELQTKPHDAREKADYAWNRRSTLDSSRP